MLPVNLLLFFVFFLHRTALLSFAGTRDDFSNGTLEILDAAALRIVSAASFVTPLPPKGFLEALRGGVTVPGSP